MGASTDAGPGLGDFLASPRGPPVRLSLGVRLLCRQGGCRSRTESPGTMAHGQIISLTCRVTDAY